MTRILLAALVLAGFGRGSAAAATAAEFIRAYRENEAERQLAANNHQAARAIYEDLAATAAGPVAGALARARAAVALGLQENRYAEGLALARSVTDRPYSVQASMQLMVASGDFPTLVAAFRDEDIAAWPPRTLPSQPRIGRPDVRALAFFDRGRAFLETGDAPAAARDLVRADEFAAHRLHRLDILSFLSRRVYGSALRDEDKVFETDLKISRLDAGYAASYHAMLAAVAYLSERARHTEALEVLERMRPATRSGSWFTRGMTVLGRTLVAAGRFAEAADAFGILARRSTPAERGGPALELAGALAAAGDLEAARAVYRELVTGPETGPAHRAEAEAALAGLAPGTAR